MPSILGSIQVAFGAETSGLMSGINMAKNALQQFASGDIMGGLATTLVGVGAAAIGVGIKSTQMAEQFQSSLVSLVTGAGESQSALKQVGDGILSIATQTGTATQQLTSGMYQIESAGYHGAAGLDVLKTAAEGAKVGNADLGTVAGALTTVLTDYHMKGEQATQAMNAMIATTAAGKMKMQDLAGSMGSVLPLAASLGINFANVGGAIATMTNQGMSAQRASMNLANAIRSLAAPGSSATKAMNEIGLSAQQLHDTLSSKGLDGAIQLIQQHINEKFPAGSVQAVQAFKAIMGGATGYNVALMLGGKNMTAYEGNIKSITDAMNKGGSTVNGWAEVTATLAFRMSQFKEIIETTGIKIGTALLPAVTAVMGFINDKLVPAIGNAFTYVNNVLRSINMRPFEEAWSSLKDAVGLVITAFGHFFAAISPLRGVGTDFDPLANAIAGIAKGALGVLTTMMERAAPIVRQLGEALNATFGPASGIITKVTGAAKPLLDTFDRATGVFKPVTDTMKPLLDTFDRAPRVLKPITDTAKPLLDTFDRATGVFHNTSSSVHTVTSAFNPFIPILRQVATDVQGLFQAFWKLSPTGNLIDALSRHAQELGKWFQSSVVPAIKQAEPSFAQLGKAIVGLIPVIEKIADIVHNSFQKAFDALLPVFEKAIPIIIRIAGIIADGLGKAIQFLAPYVVQAAAAIGKFADEIIQRVAPIISQWFDGLNAGLNFLEANWKYIWPVLSTILKGIWDMIVGVIKIAWAIVSGIIKVGLDLLSGNWGQAWKDIKDMFAGIWDGITTYFSGAWEVLKGLFMGMITAIIGVFQHLFDVLIGHSIVPDMVNGIVQWFSQLPSRVMSWIGNMASSLTGAFTHLASQALTWGSDLIGNLISGIQSQIGNLGNMASNIAGTIAKYIHFSKPDAGPLASIAEWMPDMGTLLAQGLQAQVGKLGTVSLSLAHAIAGPTGTIGIAGNGQSSASQQQSNQPVYLQIDGKTFAELLAPHMGKAQQRMTVRSTGRGW